VKREFDPHAALLRAAVTVLNPMTVSPSDLVTLAGLAQLAAGHAVEAGAVAAVNATPVPAALGGLGGGGSGSPRARGRAGRRSRRRGGGYGYDSRAGI
jgi:hypothetical protein